MKHIILNFIIPTFLSIPLAMAQGDLAPPGAPAPGMKTLAQIEPRTDIRTLAASPPYTISQPGSYYLSGNITVASGNAIVIAASDVSIDLNGFMIESTSPTLSGEGISTSGIRERISIRNGVIKGTSSVHTVTGAFTGRGFTIGISSNDLNFSQIEDLRIAGCGIGISCGRQCLVTRCIVDVCENGIFNNNFGITSDCIVTNCSDNGIAGSTVQGCTATSFSGTAISGGMVTDCHGRSNSGIGLVGADVISSSRGISASNTGIQCFGTVSHSKAASTTGAAMSAVMADGCVLSGALPSAITNRYNMP